MTTIDNGDLPEGVLAIENSSMQEQFDNWIRLKSENFTDTTYNKNSNLINNILQPESKLYYTRCFVKDISGPDGG